MVGVTAVNAASSFLPAIPILIVLIVGVGIVFTNWSRFPRVALLAVCGLGLELLATLLGVAYSASIPLLISQGNLTARQFAPLSVGIGLVLRLISAIAWGLVIAAIVVGRSGDAAGRARE